MFSKLRLNKKTFSLVVGVLIIVLVLASLLVVNNKEKSSKKSTTKAAAYCTLEFLDKVKNSTTSAGEFKKYQECKSAIIFLKDEATAVQVQELVKKIKGSEGVYKVVYTSKDEALKIYKERNKNEPILVEYVSRDILPATIEVFVTEPVLKDKIVEFAKSTSFVQSVIK